MASESRRTRGAADTRRMVVRHGVTIDGFAAGTAGPGVALRSLEPLTSLYVETRNTRYHIIVRAGAEVVIQGGACFPDPTPAHLEGATFGGSLIKLGWIGIGMRMEIRAGERCVLTTPVRSIAHAGPARPPGAQ